MIGSILFSDDDDSSSEGYSMPDITDLVQGKENVERPTPPTTSTNVVKHSRELDPIFLEMMKPKERANIFSGKEVAPRKSENPDVEMEFLIGDDVALRGRPPKPFRTPEARSRPGAPNSALSYQRKRARLLQQICASNSKRENWDDDDEEYTPVAERVRTFGTDVTPGNVSATGATTPRTRRKCRKPLMLSLDSDSESEQSLQDVQAKLRESSSNENVPKKAATKSPQRVPSTPRTSKATPSRVSWKKAKPPHLEDFSTDDDDRLIMPISQEESKEDPLCSGANENDDPTVIMCFSPEVGRSPERSPCRKTPRRDCKEKAMTGMKEMLLILDEPSDSPNKHSMPADYCFSPEISNSPEIIPSRKTPRRNCKEQGKKYIKEMMILLEEEDPSDLPGKPRLSAGSCRSPEVSPVSIRRSSRGIRKEKVSWPKAAFIKEMLILKSSPDSPATRNTRKRSLLTPTRSKTLEEKWSPDDEYVLADFVPLQPKRMRAD